MVSRKSDFEFFIISKLFFQVLPITNYTMVNRTYRYFPGEPLFPFGYGLSYTDFTYVALAVKYKTVGPGQNQTVKLEVRNDRGVHDGEEVSSVLRYFVGLIPGVIYSVYSCLRPLSIC
jgi:hypothetical protein